MADINVRSDSVNVEQIMRQIRTRIREKRGSDYTQAELQQLASAKLEQFADPSGLRSDLLEQFRKRGDEPSTYHRHRGMRRVLLMIAHPILKRVQKQLMSDLNLYFEIIHNLVVEVTRLGIEVQNLKMRNESLTSRVDFDERRARSLEGVVQYRQPRQSSSGSSGSAGSSGSRSSGSSGSAGSSGSTGYATVAPTAGPAATSSAGPAAQGAPAGPGAPAPTTPAGPVASGPGAAPGPGGAIGSQNRGDGSGRRRRRRRRRRPGHTLADSPNASNNSQSASQPGGSPSTAPDDGGQDDGPDDGGDGDDGAANQ